jgi:hypothetical protein
MPDPQEIITTREEVERIVREWQRRLGLDHWKLTIEWVEDHHCLASIYPYGNYEKATLRWNAKQGEVLGENRLYVNELSVHELFHVLRSDVDGLMERVEKWLPPAVYEAEKDRNEADIERYVDRMARFVVRLGGIV